MTKTVRREAQDNEVLKRLDVLITLLLEQKVDEKHLPMATKIRKLKALGLSASDIATILRKPLNYVTAMLSQGRKLKVKNR